ncbi:efflux RND transporter periplasmic adaptor subunit [Rubellicoccus peritrichatus]|uniref:Efflux RND transporter periplasmic adaptor subunit n=1 Tax=Rubellicoccus peritrichatus TaxID=3080537 RepID=A0AAQ3LF66_9BACT|nr:efflux RND transporter periplasmic adaptor subunit [Puniceicoccus sp. CR14]WOO43449.1 efflux RND transporter periplasmic adaptor subunit [Puniceicoccus sp. CR14]
MSATSSRYISITTMVVAALIAGCAKRNVFQEPPPPPVTVAFPFEGNVTVFNIMTGQTDAVDMVDVRARVKGFLQTMDFDPGSIVEEGDLLFTIEPDEYEAALESAKGALSSAVAQARLAETTYQRNQQLYSNEAISELDLLATKADLDLAKGNVEQAQAAVRTAELNLGYTKIDAPITGRISRELIGVGNLVGSDGNTTLTTIVKMEPMYVYFTVDERMMLNFSKSGVRPRDTPEDSPQVSLVLADGAVYPQEGYVDFADNRINPQTGTLEARAVFPNPDYVLLPGLFANVRFAEIKEKAIVVPDAVVQRDLAGDYVLVVGGDDVVERRGVKKGPLVEEGRIINEGLKASDRIVVAGLQRARPGAKVTPQEQGAQKQ